MKNEIMASEWRWLQICWQGNHSTVNCSKCGFALLLEKQVTYVLLYYHICLKSAKKNFVFYFFPLMYIVGCTVAVGPNEEPMIFHSNSSFSLQTQSGTIFISFSCSLQCDKKHKKSLGQDQKKGVKKNVLIYTPEFWMTGQRETS